jgi:microcystin-dependent protein
MTIVVVNTGEAAFLNDGVTGVAYDLRLYTNDVTAGLSSADIDELDETDFTEATFAGYAAEAVGTGDWTVTEGNPTSAANLEKSFIRSSTGTPEDVWGYYVTRDSDGALMWFEPFDGPVTIELENDQLNVTPTMTLDDAEGNAVETGFIVMSGGATAPPGWLLCDGSAVSRTTYASLFAEIGTTFGVGNGSTTFNLPEMRQRFPMGVAASGTGNVLGATGGEIDHVHDLDTATSHAKITTTGGAVAADRKSINFTDDATFTATGGATNVTANARATATTLGGDTDVENPPFLTVNFIIRT